MFQCCKVTQGATVINLCTDPLLKKVPAGITQLIGITNTDMSAGTYACVTGATNLMVGAAAVGLSALVLM